MVVPSSCMPNWLETLLSERFFSPCPTHEAAKKSEKNIFCLDCCSGFCPHCLHLHRHHRLLQIRRYVYHDVVRVEDLERLIDCASVQSYIANSAKVVFLNERAQSRPFRGGSGHHLCSSCDRPLQDPYLHCSLSCKVKHLLRREGELGRHLRECEFLPLASPCDLDDGQLSPDSIFDSPGATSSGSTSSGCGGDTRGTTATAEFLVRKKRSGSSDGSATRRTGSEPTSRRKKGVPVRAPLF